MTQDFDTEWVVLEGKTQQVQVSKSTLENPKGWAVQYSYSGKLALVGRGGEGKGMRSIALRLYGPSYLGAQHVAADPLDLRKSAFRKSKAHLERMERAKHSSVHKKTFSKADTTQKSRQAAGLAAFKASLNAGKALEDLIRNM